MNDFVDISGAAEMLGLHRTQAICVLGKSDETIITPKGRIKNLYRICRVRETIRQRECEKCERESIKGTRACYHCRNRVSACDLTSGICATCQARKLVKNFACHGDCCKFPYDCERVNILSRVIAEFQLKEFSDGI